MADKTTTEQIEDFYKDVLDLRKNLNENLKLFKDGIQELKAIIRYADMIMAETKQKIKKNENYLKVLTQDNRILSDEDKFNIARVENENAELDTTYNDLLKFESYILTVQQEYTNQQKNAAAQFEKLDKASYNLKKIIRISSGDIF